jgi:hypothetical protein
MARFPAEHESGMRMVRDPWNRDESEWKSGGGTEMGRVECGHADEEAPEERVDGPGGQTERKGVVAS